MHCLVIVDKFSKFVVLEAVPETLSAAQTAEIFLRRVVSVFGVPSLVITDRGTQFSARLWKQLLEKIGSSGCFGFLTPSANGWPKRESYSNIPSSAAIIHIRTE